VNIGNLTTKVAIRQLKIPSGAHRGSFPVAPLSETEGRPAAGIVAGTAAAASPPEPPPANSTSPPSNPSQWIFADLPSFWGWGVKDAGCVAGDPRAGSSERVLRRGPAGTYPPPRGTRRSCCLPPFLTHTLGWMCLTSSLKCRYLAGASEVAGAEALLGVCRVWELDPVDARAQHF
jgi:hypothetical protein